MEAGKNDEEMARKEFERIYRYALENNAEFAERRKFYFQVFLEGYMACAHTVLEMLKEKMKK
jgi:hypothetical protein